MSIAHCSVRRGSELLAVATTDGWLHSWLPLDNRVIASHPLGARINTTSWTSDARFLVASTGDALHVFDGDGVTRLHHHAAKGGSLLAAVHPSRPLVATSGDGGRVRLWDLDDPGAPRKVPLRAPRNSAPSFGLALTEDEVLIGSRSGELTVYDHGGQRTGKLELGRSAITTIAVSPDGRTAVAGASRGALFRLAREGAWTEAGRLWGGPGEGLSINTVEVLADDRIVVAASDNCARVFVRGVPSATLGKPFDTSKHLTGWDDRCIVSSACAVPGTPAIAVARYRGGLELWRVDATARLVDTVSFASGQPSWAAAADPVAAWRQLVG